MWKKIRYVIYFAVLIGVFSFTYSYREYYYIPFIQKGLDKISDSKLKFRNFSIELPFNLVVYDIRYDKKLFIDKTVLRFEPFMFLHNIKTPLKSLSVLYIDRLVYLDENPEKKASVSDVNEKNSENRTVLKKFLSFFDFSGEISSADVVYGKNLLKFRDIHFRFNKELYTDAKIKYLNHDIKTTGTMKFEDKFLTGKFYVKTDGELKSDSNLTAVYNFNDKSFVCSADTKNLFFNRLSFEDVRTNIKNTYPFFSLKTSGKNINLSANLDVKTKVLISSGTIKIRDINDVVNTGLKYSAKINNKSIEYLKVKALNTIVFGNDFGNFNFEITNNDNGSYNVLGLHDSGTNFKTVLKKNGSYKTEVYNKEIKIGDVSGNYKKGEISVDVKNIPVKKLPFINNLSKTAKGTVSLYGKIGSKKGTVYLNAKQLASKKLKGFDVFGTLHKENFVWTADVETNDKKIIIKGFYENKKKNGADIFYNGVNSHNLLEILGVKNPKLYGMLDGTIKYSSTDYVTYINTKLKNGSLFNNKFITWDISADVSKTQLNISTFTFKGTNSKIDIKSSIDFTKQEGNSYFNFLIKNFKINKKTNLNYNLNFVGQYVGGGVVEGNYKVDKFSLGGFNFPHEAFASISLNKIDIKNFNNDNGLSGEASYDLSSKKFDVLLKTNKSKISKYYSGIKGRLTSVLKLSGDADNPEASFNADIKNALYENILFNSKINLSYKVKKFYLKKLFLTSGQKNETKINAYGVTDDKKTNINIVFSGVSEQIINKYVGFRTPFEGSFYGNGTLSGQLKNLKASLNLYADTLFIKTLKLNSFSAKLKAKQKNKTVSIDKAKVKISDSEIKILSADFNAKTGKYNSKIKFVNTHLGLFDVFGNMKINGKLTPGKNGSKYDGNIDFDDLWLNEEKIDSLSLKYLINNRNFYFKTLKNNPLKISGDINFNKYPKIIFKNILINRYGRKFSLNGNYLHNDMLLNVHGKNIDLETMADLFNFPVDTSGSVNFNLKTSGSISNPAINLKMNSADGSIYHVPYDLFTADINVRNNNLTIDNFKVIKSGKYELSADGNFPFWLDSSLKEKMMKLPVNVNYKLNDTGLYILTNLSENSITAKKGTLKINGKLTGIRKNISNIGKLSLTGKNVKTGSYINKIKDLNADIVWNNNLFKIQKFHIKAGSGTAEAAGTVKMQGLVPSFYNLNFYTPKKGVPVVIKDLPIPTSGVFKMESGSFANFSKGVPTFNFKLYGSAKKPKLTGWASLENTVFCFPSPIKNKYKEIPYFISRLLENLSVNINLKTANNTRYENSFINMLLRGSVNIKGKIDELLANGVVTSADGIFSYMGNDFDIINSKMELINNELFITAEAESEVYTTGESAAEVIKIYIDRSDINNIKTRFASKNDPTMDSKKALAKLTKTDPSDTSTLDTSTDFLVKQQAVRMFSSSIATPLANTVLKKTGIVDNVRIGFVNQDTLQVADNEEVSVAELLYGMKYSVEKNINRLLQIGYSVTFDKIQKEIDLKQAVEMSFKLNRNLFLKGSYGLNSDNPEYEPEKRLMLEQRIRF